MRLGLLVTRQLEVVGQLKVGFRVTFPRHEVHDQRIFDREDGIIRDVLVSSVKDLRYYWFVSRRRNLYEAARQPEILLTTRL